VVGGGGGVVGWGGGGGGGGGGWGRGGNVKRILKVWFSVKKKSVNKSLIIQWYLCKIN